jgi:hypothetical protein
MRAPNARSRLDEIVQEIVEEIQKARTRRGDLGRQDGSNKPPDAPDGQEFREPPFIDAPDGQEPQKVSNPLTLLRRE